MKEEKRELPRIRRLVVKIGSNCLVTDGRPDGKKVARLADAIASVMRTGREVLLVSSGAVASGRAVLGWTASKRIEEKQACAAVGQIVLMDLYNRAFRRRGLTTGQILLVESDFDDREHYLNARHTLDVLLKHHIVPVINENDTVSTSEIVFGDNDMLSALITNLVDADALVILTGVGGLLDGEGRIVREISRVDDGVRALVRKAVSSAGRGGMETKLKAMETVTRSGKTGFVACAEERDILKRLCAGEAIGTLFRSAAGGSASRKRWLAFGTAVKGRIVVDAGAEKALSAKKSLLASGIVSVGGSFAARAVVEILSSSGRVLGRGLSSCSSADLLRIRGLRSAEFEKVLGRKIPAEIVHRDNLVLEDGDAVWNLGKSE